VGLVQREIEAAGLSTITLSCVPDLTASVSVPRVAGLEHPLGIVLGKPGDSEGQMAVLRATLQSLVGMTEPGSVEHLPFEWPEPPKKVHNHPPEPPPISKYLFRRPWLLPKLLSREVLG
jgi:D-proline reductase (dithiol) PrdB